MTKKREDYSAIFGLIFTIASAVFCIGFGFSFFIEARLRETLFDVGVDSLGALFCAALYFGCMKQKGNGIGALRRSAKIL